MLSFPVCAQENDFTITGESLSANQGDEIQVKFSFENNPGVSIISLNLEYDFDALELVEIEGNPLMPGNFSGNTDENFIFWCNYTGDVAYNGVAFTAYFNVKDYAPTGDTVVTVTPAYTSGSILNNNYEDIYPKVTDSVITISGNFQAGDVDCNGIINTNDAIKLISILLDESPQTENCNVNNDDNVDIIDLIALKKILISG